MIKVLAGSFKPSTVFTFGVDQWTRKPKFLMVQEGWLPKKIEMHDITSVILVTQENSTSIAGKAVWGAAGALMLGPVGLLAGVLGGGNHRRQIVEIELRDGRAALLECGGNDAKIFQALEYELRTSFQRQAT